MPLRKQGTIIQTSAIALVIAAAAFPTSANAFSIFDLLSRKAPAKIVTPTAPTAPAAPATPAPAEDTEEAEQAPAAEEAPEVTEAPAAPTVESTTEVASDVADLILADDAVADQVLQADPNACPVQPVRKAFARYKDTADYSLAPNGDFENNGAGWTLLLGAKIAKGNESLGVSAGSKSLSLPIGGTALSPEFCVDETNPHFRFAAKPGGAVSGYAAVVLYRDTAGKVKQAQFTSSANIAFSKGSWTPSAISPLATKIPLLGNGKTATVQLLFVSTGNALALSNLWGKLAMGAIGNVSIDSVMVDPYRRG